MTKTIEKVIYTVLKIDVKIKLLSRLYRIMETAPKPQTEANRPCKNLFILMWLLLLFSY